MATVATEKQVQCTFVVDGQEVVIPPWVKDLESFRRWADSEEFPEDGRICYIKGEVWVDMSKEQFFTHGQVKHQFAVVVGGLINAGMLGRYLPDGTRLSNVEADISVVPDGGFVSRESLQSGQVRLVAGRQGGYVELEGAPDMVLEVVSQSSIHKDTDVLSQAYWEAGIREYWLVDARKEPLRFDIFRRTAKGYIAAPKKGGWVKSAVFGKSFRLTQQTDEHGLPEYRLGAR